MRKMVLHMVHDTFETAADRPLELVFHSGARSLRLQTLKHQRRIRPFRERISPLPPQVGARILIDRNVLHCAQRDTRLVETVLNGL